MAVFLINVCKFSGCGLIFQTLGDLIQHIEEVHIDYDPQTIERQEQQQPPCLPLSYVLRFFTEAARRENLERRKSILNKPTVITSSVQPVLASLTATSINCAASTGSEFEDDMFSDSEEEDEDDDSNDSWSSYDAFGTDVIVKMINGGINGGKDLESKPFACPMPGCKKRYKNINGIKYHARNGHRRGNIASNINTAKKEYKCHCGKSYKTSNGLRNHSLTHQVSAVSSAAGTTNASPTATNDVPNSSTTTVSIVNPAIFTALSQSSVAVVSKDTAQTSPLIVSSVPSAVSPQLAAALTHATTQKEVLQVMSIAAMQPLPKSASMSYPLGTATDVGTKSIHFPLCLPVSPVAPAHVSTVQIPASLMTASLAVTPALSTGNVKANSLMVAATETG